MSDSIAELFKGHTPGDPVTGKWPHLGGYVSDLSDADMRLVLCAPLIPDMIHILKECERAMMGEPTQPEYFRITDIRALLALLEGGKS